MFGHWKKKPDPDPRARENVDRRDFKFLAATTGAAVLVAAPVATAVAVGVTALTLAAVVDAAFSDD